MKAQAANGITSCETTELHPRLIKCALAVEECRAYWERLAPNEPEPVAQAAFEDYWFGAKSLPWVREIVSAMRHRFDAFPEALHVLRRWRIMAPETRAAICHWHLQLSDPLYRSFAGDFLPARHNALRPEIHRSSVIVWIKDHGRSRWTLPTRKNLATGLLSAALAAGLVSGRRDPRQLAFPRITDEALAYLLYLLRGVTFTGTLLDNPYLRSVGLEGGALESRLRALPSLRYGRTGDVFEFAWRYPSLTTWAEGELFAEGGPA